MTSLYPSTRSSNCIFINCILINLKQRPVKITGKNIKSYATPQVHFPREREGSLTAKSPNLSFKNMIRLNRTYYSLLKFSQAKLLKICANSFLLVFAVSGPFTSFLVLHTVSWFSRSEVCAFVWGIFVRGLRVETFVRVLRSSDSFQ